MFREAIYASNPFDDSIPYQLNLRIVTLSERIIPTIHVLTQIVRLYVGKHFANFNSQIAWV